MLRAVFLSLLLLLALPAAAADALPGGALGPESDADIWRQVRQGRSFSLSGTTSGTAVLVQSEGEQWRALRNGPISTYGGWLLVLAGAGVALFFLVRGRVRLAAFRCKKQQIGDLGGIQGVVTACANGRNVMEEAIEHYGMDLPVMGLGELLAGYLDPQP